MVRGVLARELANAPIIRLLAAGMSSSTEGVGGAFSSISVRNVSSLAIPRAGVLAL